MMVYSDSELKHGSVYNGVQITPQLPLYQQNHFLSMIGLRALERTLIFTSLVHIIYHKPGYPIGKFKTAITAVKT